MPNYEEMYYISKRNYENAVSEKNMIRSKASELNGEKSKLIKELDEKNKALADIKNKLVVVRAAHDKCIEIINGEFEGMKKDLNQTGTEFKEIFQTDEGVADLSEIYSEDITNTNNDLNNISESLKRSIKQLEADEQAFQNAVNQYSQNLNSVNAKIKNLGDDVSAQKRAETYYVEMQEYKKRWQNGE